MKNLAVKVMIPLFVMLSVIAAVVFAAAWTFDYWQGWAFVAVVSVSTLALVVYWLLYDRQMLEKRFSVRPSDEQSRGQQIVQALVRPLILLFLIIPVLDHRFQWSVVPAYVSVIGDGLIALGMFIVILVFKENRFASPLVEVDSEQTVISTGPYAIVRHPMYSAALIWFAGVPLALGSAWGLLMVVPVAMGLAWRLGHEEALLVKELAGYQAYKGKVRRRLMPLVW
jgi:protein-S-isoprenylcysteine O-methyltransferase Ste14